eukprot:Skav220782  [mRNA]  locus=scaffold3169:188687:203995:+ [translate_table: standard]
MSSANSEGVINTHALPPAVHWGSPAKEALPSAIKKLECSRAFLMVSGTLLSEGKGAVDEIVAALGEMCAGVWHGMPAHTPRDAVLAAAMEAKKADADVIVTIGGGSLTDGAKVVRIALETGALRGVCRSMGCELRHDLEMLLERNLGDQLLDLDVGGAKGPRRMSTRGRFDGYEGLPGQHRMPATEPSGFTWADPSSGHSVKCDCRQKVAQCTSTATITMVTGRLLTRDDDCNFVLRITNAGGNLATLLDGAKVLGFTMFLTSKAPTRPMVTLYETQ